MIENDPIIGENYYRNTLMLYAIGFDRGLYRFDRNGYLLISPKAQLTQVPPKAAVPVDKSAEKDEHQEESEEAPEQNQAAGNATPAPAGNATPAPADNAPKAVQLPTQTAAPVAPADNAAPAAPATAAPAPAAVSAPAPVSSAPATTEETNK